MKTVLYFISILILTTSSYVVAAPHTLTASDVEFGINGTLLKYLGTATDIIIPDSIDSKPIEIISAYAFQKKGLEKVEMANSITSIGYYAFQDNLIKSVKLSSTLKSIGDRAFKDNVIDSIFIPASVEEIGQAAFTSSGIKSVTFEENSSLKTLGYSVFEANLIDTIKIPNSVVSIGTYAFLNNPIKSVIFGDSVKTIGKMSFKNCSLTTVTIPKSVINILEYSFVDNQIESVNIEKPTSLKGIGRYAFSGNKITSLEIPSGIEYISNGAFGENVINNLTFEQPVTITNIDTTVFVRNNLTNLTIPKEIKSIGLAAFRENPITDIIFEDQSIINKIEGYSFYKSQLSSLVIPSTVDTIGEQAFSNNNLASLNFTSPSSLQSIGPGAFSYNNLTTVEIPDGVEILDSIVFKSNDIANIKFPANLKVIGDNCFAYNEFDTLIVPPSIIDIGDEAFQVNRLVSVTFNLDSSYLQRIGDGAFYVGTAGSKKVEPLDSIILPKSLKGNDTLLLWTGSFSGLHKNANGYYVKTEFGSTGEVLAKFPVRFKPFPTDTINVHSSFIFDLENYMDGNIGESLDPKIIGQAMGGITFSKYKYTARSYDVGTNIDTLTLTAYNVTDTAFIFVEVLNTLPYGTNYDRFPGDSQIYPGDTLYFEFRSRDEDSQKQYFSLSPNSAGTITEEGIYTFIAPLDYLKKAETFELCLTDSYDTVKTTFTFNSDVAIINNPYSKDNNLLSVRIVPNILKANIPMQLLFPNNTSANIEFGIFDVVGNKIHEQNGSISNNNSTIRINSEQLYFSGSGLYMILGRATYNDGSIKYFKLPIGIKK